MMSNIASSEGTPLSTDDNANDQIAVAQENLGTDAANHYSCKYHQSVSAYVQGRSGDGTTTTDITSSLTMDTNFHAYKSESLGTKILYTMEGSLEISKTTNLAPGKGNPSIRVGMNPADSGGSTAQIRYLEAYNT